MGKTYLFSPIGNTDPIKYFHDGSMLHICRHYKPDVVYFYLSKEMVENHRADNRYVRTLELLGEYLHHTFEIHVIEDEKMVDVQQYDVFYEKFRELIGGIEKEMAEDDTLLVNMASGTPAMKSALLVMATLTEYRFLPVQVSTPKKAGNTEHEEREDYDTEINWELDEDNKPDAENRCSESRCYNLMRLLKIDIIKKHLLSYNYQAALEVGKDIKKDLSDEAYCWLETAAARAGLDWNKMNQFLPKGNGIVTPVKAENLKRNLFEYTLALELKLHRGEYADFVRAITPLGVDLLELVITEYCGIDIKLYYFERNHKKEWKIEELKSSGLEVFTRNKKNKGLSGPIYAWQLNNIIQARCKDVNLKRRTNELLEIEKRARNLAAHNVVSVTKEWVKEQTGKQVDEIMWIIKYICERVKINTREENWKSYDRMNEQIIRELEK